MPGRLPNFSRNITLNCSKKFIPGPPWMLWLETGEQKTGKEFVSSRRERYGGFSMQEPGPKRLLALDGGGVRGLVSLGFLARIERILRQRYEKPALLLSDYFDRH
jgi:hypothetical protein